MATRGEHSPWPTIMIPLKWCRGIGDLPEFVVCVPHHVPGSTSEWCRCPLLKFQPDSTGGSRYCTVCCHVCHYDDQVLAYSVGILMLMWECVKTGTTSQLYGEVPIDIWLLFSMLHQQCGITDWRNVAYLLCHKSLTAPTSRVIEAMYRHPAAVSDSVRTVFRLVDSMLNHMRSKDADAVAALKLQIADAVIAVANDAAAADAVDTYSNSDDDDVHSDDAVGGIAGLRPTIPPRPP